MPSSNPTIPNQASAIDAINVMVAGLLERADKAASPEERALYGILSAILIFAIFAVAVFVLYRTGWLTRHHHPVAPPTTQGPSPSAQVRAAEIKAAVEAAETRMKAAIEAAKGEQIEATKKLLQQRKATDTNPAMAAMGVRLTNIEGMLKRTLESGSDNDSAEKPAVGGTNGRGRRPTGRSGSND